MNLDEYIIFNADRQIESDFLRRFSDVEVFFVLPTDIEVTQKGAIDFSTDGQMQLQTANFEKTKMGLFYASKNDARLGSRFAGIPLIGAARVVCHSHGIDGLFVQSSADAWVCFLKQQLREVIGQVRDRVFYKSFEPPLS
jgi:hypothetical protein